MDWDDFSNAAGVMLPGLAILTVVMVVAIAYVILRFAWVVARPNDR